MASYATIHPVGANRGKSHFTHLRCVLEYGERRKKRKWVEKKGRENKGKENNFFICVLENERK